MIQATIATLGFLGWVVIQGTPTEINEESFLYKLQLVGAWLFILTILMLVGDGIYFLANNYP